MSAKIYIAGFIFWTIAVFGVGHKVCSAGWLKGQLKVQTAAIENTNEDSDTLRIVREDIENASERTTREIITLPPIIIDNTKPCPASSALGGVNRMQHSISKALAEVRVQ